ncbi:hypothetical protein OIU77_000745 [Salix suchowensis]|uniref:Uncharacterized protein n=1 Tax=Salix suchowensis TaxID=1278906 RepID=A0ABQ9B8V8_9ROSI|nr:hypothetical protein OIU77_000745 [Salix suchowensis]
MENICMQLLRKAVRIEFFSRLDQKYICLKISSVGGAPQKQTILFFNFKIDSRIHLLPEFSWKK